MQYFIGYDQSQQINQDQQDEKQKEDFFADNEQIAEYAKEAVYVMKASAIINGSGDNQFLPKNRATRAEAAKIIAGIVRQLK